MTTSLTPAFRGSTLLLSSAARGSTHLLAPAVRGSSLLLPSAVRGLSFLLLLLLLLLQHTTITHAVGAVWLTENNLNSLGYNNFSKEDPRKIRFQERTTLRVAVEHWEPHIRVEKVDDQIHIYGPMANLLRALGDALNFNYTLVRPPDGAWGAPDSNGVWNGMIGMVKRNEADLAMGPFGITEARAKVVEFSQPILIDYFRILVKRGSAKPNPWGFFNPLGPLVWVGLLLSLLLVCVGLWLFVFFGPGMREWSISSKITYAFKQTWDQFANLCQQTMVYSPDEMPLRMLVSVWLMTVLVIMRSYSGALTSLLAVRQIPIKINTLRDLIQAKEYGVIFETSTALTAYMGMAESGVFAEMEKENKKGRCQFLKANELFDAAFNLVRSQDYALLVEESTIRKIMSDDFSVTERCDFYMAKQTYFPLIFCIIGRKGMSLMPSINFRIQSLVEHNLYSEWIGKELQNETACLRAPTSITVNEPYNMTGLWGVFMVLFMGLFVSFVTFVGELVVHFLHQRETLTMIEELQANSNKIRHFHKTVLMKHR